MQFDVNNPYFRTKVLTASREELRMLLLDGCAKFMRAGRAALAAKNYEVVYESFTSAKAILIELINTLDHKSDPELCKKMSALYTYMYRRLTEGSHQKDLAKIDEAIGLMDFECETWRLLMDKLASERAQGRDPVADAAQRLGRPISEHAHANGAQGVPQGHENGKRPALSISG